MDSDAAIIRIDTTPRFAEVEVLEPEPASPRAMIDALANAVVSRMQGPRLSDAEQVQHWAKAFDHWLHRAPKTGAPRPAATVAAYETAWADLRAFTRKETRFIESLDIRDWIADLRMRPIDPTVAGGLIRNGRRQPGQVGLSNATINQWVAGISSFFSFCQHYDVRTAEGAVVRLLEGPNPAKSYMVERPETKRLGQEVMWLSNEQIQAVLNAIRCAQTLADLERGVASCERTVRELRDYALIYTYALTVARNREIRELRWQDLVKRGPKMYYNWANKGKDGSDELPEKCWRAIQNYLRLAGRLEGMQPGDFIFQPTSDAITRMRRPDGSPVIPEGAWDRNRAISAQEANRILRRYCRRAGIAEADVPRIHVHSLRHSGVMLYLQGGVPVERVSKRAHHSSLDMTMGYTHELAGQANPDWEIADSLLGQ